MARRSRAAQTKSRLWEIMQERSERGTDSLDVVQVFNSRFPKIDERERDDLVDIGLMVLAGRVVVSNRPNNDEADLFSNSGYPDFIPIKVMSGNKSTTKIMRGRTLTAREYFGVSQKPVEKTKKADTLSKRGSFQKCMEEMRDKHLLDMTVVEYLDRNKSD